MANEAVRYRAESLPLVVYACFNYGLIAALAAIRLATGFYGKFAVATEHSFSDWLDFWCLPICGVGLSVDPLLYLVKYLTEFEITTRGVTEIRRGKIKRSLQWDDIRSAKFEKSVLSPSCLVLKPEKGRRMRILLARDRRQAFRDMLKGLVAEEHPVMKALDTK